MPTNPPSELVADKRRRYLALFAHVLHIGPLEVDQLTIEDFHVLCAYLDQYLRDQKKQSTQ